MDAQTIPSDKEKPGSNLDRMASDATQEKSAASFMDPGAKKRGRPKGSTKKASPEKAEPETIIPVVDIEKEREALKPVLAPVFNLMSIAGVKAAEDERAAIPPENQELMTHSAAGCVAKYLPGISEHADAICLTVMMSTWAMTIMALRAENLMKMRERASQTNGARPPSEAHPSLMPSLN